MPELNRQLVEAASWRLATELVRRDPQLLIRLHPGGGQCDCLALMTVEGEQLAHLSRQGSVQLRRGRTGSHSEVWREVLQDRAALARWLQRIASDLDLPNTLPPTTPRVLVYRVIANLLAYRVFDREAWECRGGFHDSSGEFSGVAQGYFDAVAAAKDDYDRRSAGGLHEAAAYEYWFICVDGAAMAALHESGVAWLPQGPAIDLWAHYQSRRKLAPLVFECFGSLLG